MTIEPSQLDASHFSPPRKLLALVQTLFVEFQDKQVGHCVRVDHLSATDCRACCRELQQRLDDGVAAFVLSHDDHDALYVPADKAIEIRNRKVRSLCLFVPSNLQDAAVSSLGNSFSSFDLQLFLRTLAENMKADVPAGISEMVSAVLRQLKRSARVPVEDVIDYLSVILDSPLPATVGAELWRVGLIPDITNHIEFSRRLDLNRSSVERLARPARAYAGVSERVASLKLASETIQSDLIQYLMGKRLQSDRTWLRMLAEEPWRGKLSFDQWKFADVEQSELERVEIVPFYQNDIVRAGCGLEQDAPGTVPYARCGIRKSVVVRWQTEPTKLSDVTQWRVEMIPDRDKYNVREDEVGTELPSVTVRGNLRQAKLPLDIIGDVDTLQIREVQIRVAGLDANGSEILIPDKDEPIEGISQSFYLEQLDETSVSGSKPRRMPTERSLPDALLAWTMKSRDKDRRVVPLPPEDRDLLYLPFQVNDKAVIRVATSEFLRVIEQETLANYASGGRYSAQVSGVATLTREKVESQAVTLPEKLLPAWDRFLQARKQIFSAISSQAARGLVITADLTPTVCKQVQLYARFYCDLLDETMKAAKENAGAVDAETVEALLTLDTLTLEFQYLAGPSQATVFLPTHPARLLWYVAYSEWLSKIENELLALPTSQRAARLSEKVLRYISPHNLPALLVRPTTDQSEIFADNLTMFHAVTVPVGISDPGTLVAEVARVLGLDGFEQSQADLQPEDAAAEVSNYLKLHSYLKTLRVSAVNPGSGEFLRTTLDRALHGLTSEDDDLQNEKHLDLITHGPADIQTPTPGLEIMSKEWYNRGQRQRGNHLRPAVQIARRILSNENLLGLPGGDVHITFCLDHYNPTISIRTREPSPSASGPRDGTSASVFGLLTRFQTKFTAQDGIAIWERGISFSGDHVIERHPANRIYSDLLIDVQESYLTVCGLALGGTPAESPQPVFRLEVGPEERQLISILHQQSDWVITIDRHFGAEYYDAPLDTFLSKEAEHYLLDYTPEFVDGLGHRLVVTTQWKEEIVDILSRAMDELGLACDATNSAALLNTLKNVSGRLALRLIGNDSGDIGQDTLAKETVSLGVVANYLAHTGDLADTIIVPLDAHKRIFLDAKSMYATDTSSRCDFLLIRTSRQRLSVEYIEVKYRQGSNPIPSALFDQIADQTTRTDKMLRSVYFADPPRLDAPVLRCQLAAILRFYAQRARRQGRIPEHTRYSEILENLMRVEMGSVKVVSKYRGIIVHLGGVPQKAFKHGEVTIQILTGLELEKYTDFQLSTIPTPNTESSVEPQPTTVKGRGVEPAAGIGHSEALTEIPRTYNGGSLTKVGVHKQELSAIARTKDKTESPTSPELLDRQKLAVPLGINLHTDEEVLWLGTVQGSSHLFLMGIPGQGKSWTVLRLLSEVANQNVPSLVLDFHGQFADTSTAFGAASNPIVLDISEGLPFSPLEAIAGGGNGPAQWRLNSFQIAEVIQYLCDLGDMQRDLLYEAIRDTYTLAGYAEIGAPTEKQSAEPITMAAVFEQLRSLEQKRRGISNTSARVRPLFEFNLFREDIASIDFSVIGKRTVVIDLHKVGMEVLQMAAAAFVLRKLYKDMFQWGETDRPRLLVVLDEAHRLAKDVTLPKLMKEGRKFGIIVVVASQTMQDFHPEVLQNAGTKILYRTNYPQSKKIVGYLKPPHYISDLAARLEGLPVGHALVQTPQMRSCAEVQMFPYQGEN